MKEDMSAANRPKKGYFFTFDAVIGITILIISIFLVAGIYFYSPQKTGTDEMSRQVAGLLNDVKIRELCQDLKGCDCSYDSLETLCNQGEIRNPDISIMEFFGELYSRPADRRVEIAALIDEILIDNNIIPKNFDMKIWLSDPATGQNNVQLYPLEIIV